ncbi:50S ribosomal protein L23 [Candidatus Arcanobacter lacustris]|jgi:large subunit ribosomal protein L23|uniref:Large ribosomal subunit protein uL23 n=1 Tax=Candidatus Arcanibacter lacustris TaxID=1607817 RepID=A0A0F5MPD0_9RICK|nr:50S ribosomal protein L23 [Candidatus Arcanobacter lacustris]
MDNYDLIRSPVVTEKSTNLVSQNKYIFKVDVNATKAQVKKAIEEIFEVTVAKVNTINIAGKVKRFRGILGKRKSYKKAVVTLNDGQNIDVTVGVK